MRLRDPVWLQGTGKGACSIKQGAPGWGAARERPVRTACLGGVRLGGGQALRLVCGLARQEALACLSAIELFGPSPRRLHKPSLLPTPCLHEGFRNPPRWWQNCFWEDCFQKTFQEWKACPRCITDLISVFMFSVGASLWMIIPPLSFPRRTMWRGAFLVREGVQKYGRGGGQRASV